MKRLLQYSIVAGIFRAMGPCLLILLISLTLLTGKLNGQSCFKVFAGKDTVISCTLPCFDLNVRIPDIRTSEDYKVFSIPYDPYPYLTSAPAFLHPCLLDQDDKYSPVFTLPFSFCFYGTLHTQYVLGTNGVITFDISNAMKGNNYQVFNSLPFVGSGTPIYACPTPPQPAGVLYPKLAIFGNYVDLFPDKNDPNYKIEARVEGSAPCRKFIMSYYQVKLFQCRTNRVTFEVVLHESTGIIDVYTRDLPLCPAPTLISAIIGIQKDGLPGTPFTSPPGRNLFNSAISNEGWRFIPSGPISLLDKVILYRNGVQIATGNTTSLGNGELQAVFNGICQSEDSMSYIVKAFYHSCDDPSVITEGSDTIIVYKTLNPLTVNVTNPNCFGNGLGNITVINPTASNIEYSCNAGASWQSSPSFNVPTGNYMIKARIVGTNCDGDTAVTVFVPPLLTATSTATSASCDNNNGSIKAIAAGGILPYEYSLDGNTTFFPSNTFTGLPVGLHTVTVRDANSCTITTSTDVLLTNDTMRLDLGPDSTICDGVSLILLPQTNNATSIFNWTPATWLSNVAIKNPIARPRDTITYFLTARWGACQRTDSITINVNPKPVISVVYDTTAIIGSPHQLLATGGINYVWSPAAVLNNSFISNPVATLFDNTQLRVAATNSYGCTNYAYINIKVYLGPTYYIPTAFTPNNDGLNDVLSFVPVGIKETEYFRVFNRWGQLVFESNHWKKGWDGKHNGSAGLQGVYVWMIKGKDKDDRVITMNGTVTLIR